MAQDERKKERERKDQLVQEIGKELKKLMNEFKDCVKIKAYLEEHQHNIQNLNTTDLQQMLNEIQIKSFHF